MTIDYERNNLDTAASPYLRQHQDNPINWQEWGEGALEYAREREKLIFVSVGYATCHWCHVMAREAFSDRAVAESLNAGFVSIKVDREQRPDIDRYLMDFMVGTEGHGGWPLNVILTPDGDPIVALTYLPPRPQRGLPGLVEVLGEVLDWYRSRGGRPGRYAIEKEPLSAGYEQTALLKLVERTFDREFGGFGRETKFPPYATLLLLMSVYEQTHDGAIAPVVTKTLDMMAMRGLHDHLQGGFFRYSVDRGWTIPHFEKMLYDQAMHLWVYSWGSKLFGKDAYRAVVDRLILCLDETFRSGDLYISAHDADTDHVEGGTYVWSTGDLKAVLSPDEFDRFSDVYEISEAGNFEGKNHLIKKELKTLPNIEKRLLEERKKRAQPFADEKIITSWNALLGTSLIMAHRYAGATRARDDARRLFEELMREHAGGGRLIHSSFGGVRQEQEFLEDYAAMLLLATFLYEERLVERAEVERLFNAVQSFREQDIWYANRAADFMRIPAETFDQPIPSPSSTALFASWRTARILDIDYDEPPAGFGTPMAQDFFSLAAYLSGGRYHELHAPKLLDWSRLPISSMQLAGDRYQDCYLHYCREFENETELFADLAGR